MRLDDRTRRALTFTVIALILISIIIVFDKVNVAGNDAMKYYLKNFIEQTGARNAVAAIYLNYRVFDTFFEALLLIVSVSGIIYFLEEKGHDDTE